jgi:hypothetical protein
MSGDGLRCDRCACDHHPAEDCVLRSALARIREESAEALRVAVLERALEEVVKALGPSAPDCGCDGCEAETTHAYNAARAVLAAGRRGEVVSEPNRCKRCGLMIRQVSADGFVHNGEVECEGARITALELSRIALVAARSEILDAIDDPDPTVFTKIAAAMDYFDA